MAIVTFDLAEDQVVDSQKVITSTWSNNTNALISTGGILTSSIQANFSSPTGSGQFFINVFDAATSSADATVQYAVGYGHRAGSGSQNFTDDTGSKGISATRVIYNQYRQLVFGDEASNFKFQDHTSNDIYFINVSRKNYKHNLRPGTLNLTLSGSSEGSKFLHLTDDSITSTGSAVVTNAGRQFNIVSGSNGIRSGSTNAQLGESASFGLFYPDAGFIILNPDALRAATDNKTLVTNKTGNTNARNGELLVNHISGGKSFIVDSEEHITSQYYFVRAKSKQFNYTTNPSFIDNEGNLLFTSMIDNPQTFITTIGLYNDNNDLVAVAKLSQPLKKDYTKEALIRVKLDY